MDFTPCTQFKFVQYPDGRLALRLRLREGESPEAVRKQALVRWEKRIPDVELTVEFVDAMSVDPCTGNFKNIERLTADCEC
jgi:hypothetical protein